MVKELKENIHIKMKQSIRMTSHQIEKNIKDTNTFFKKPKKNSSVEK